MPIERIYRGELQRDDGKLVAKDVSLAMLSEDNDNSLADARGTISVLDDPAFARRYSPGRFVFVSTYDREEKIDVFILDANGACLAFSVNAKSLA